MDSKHCSVAKFAKLFLDPMVLMYSVLMNLKDGQIYVKLSTFSFVKVDCCTVL